MSFKFSLDSYAWVEYFIGSNMGEFVDFLLKNTSCITPSIVIAELSDKFHREKLLKEWSVLFKFIKHNTEVIPLDSMLAEKSRLCKNILREQQDSSEKKIGLADAIILQTAILKESTLVTGDKHFKEIKGVIYLKNLKEVEKLRKNIMNDLF